MARGRHWSGSARPRDRAALRAAVTRDNRSIRAFARAVGVSHAMLHGLFNGQRPTCSASLADAIEREAHAAPGSLFAVENRHASAQQRGGLETWTPGRM